MSKTGSEIQNALILSESSSAADVAERGTSVIRRIAGSLVASTDGGAYGAFGGSSISVDWFPTMFNYLRGKLGSNLAAYHPMDFTHGSSGGTLEYAASGTNHNETPDSTTRGGVLAAQTGGAGTSQCYVAPIGAPTLVLNPKTEVWAVAARIMNATAQEAATNYVLARLGAIGFGSTVEISVTNGVVNLRLFDGTLVTQATTFTAPAQGVWTDVALMFDTTKVFAAIGQVMSTGMVDVVEQITDLTHVPTGQSNCQAGVETTLAAVRSAKIDKLMCAYQLA